LHISASLNTVVEGDLCDCPCA